MRYLVASVAVMEGGREEFEATKKLYREADVADFKEDCLFGTIDHHPPSQISSAFPKKIINFGGGLVIGLKGM